MSSESKDARRPTLGQAVFALVVVIGVVIAGIRLGIGAQMALFMGAVASIIIALLFKNEWADIQKTALQTLANGMLAVIIIMIVGMMIGFWIIGGTVPALVYYGLIFVSPEVIVPLTFVLCSITSILTGTSIGSLGTMGLALVGVAAGIGVPAHIVAGAAVSGALFGDKMSPMSDTTNMASGLSDTGLYDHIGSMLYTTVPAFLVCLAVYAFLGSEYSAHSANTDTISQLLASLQEHFWITPLALIPPLCVLIVSAMRVPAILGLGGCTVLSFISAMLLQGKSFIDVMAVGYNGFRLQSDTGLDMLARLLNRGGLSSVSGTVFLIILACIMGGALTSSKVLTVLLEDFLLKVVKKPSSLVYATMVYCYVIMGLSGNQVLGIIMGGPAFGEAYDRMNVHRKVLSRTLEDVNTIGCVLLPWSIMTGVVASILGVGMEFIPYSLLSYVVPVFSVICAASGFGMWKSDGTKMWGSQKTASQP